MVQSLELEECFFLLWPFSASCPTYLVLKCIESLSVVKDRYSNPKTAAHVAVDLSVKQ